MPNIYLIGMMGSGKSVTGKKLAALLGCSFMDLDEVVQKRAGCSITEIFIKKGESHFRDLERELLKEAASKDKHVVATGGGVVLSDENSRKMRGTGKVVYLETSLETLWNRVQAKRERPLLAGDQPKETLKNILSKRKALYEKASDFRVPTDGQTDEAVARQILKELDKKP